jgi:hypothetical protein
MFGLLKYVLLLTGGLISLSPVWGQSDLRDPMLPPAQYRTGAALSSEMASGAREPVVQVLIVGRDRQFAVIDGHVLKRGQYMDQWRLVNITDRGVLLSDGDAVRKVSVHPAVVKKIVSRPATGTTPKNTNP